jgi:outer membrane receptor for monomeric catechols
MFRKQLEVLQNTIAEDLTSTVRGFILWRSYLTLQKGAQCIASWFKSPKSEGAAVVKGDSFWVRVMNISTRTHAELSLQLYIMAFAPEQCDQLALTFGVGTTIDALVSFQRIDTDATPALKSVSNLKKF